jgi:hypothetical protein
MFPWPSKITPEPRPLDVEISTTDGRTLLTTLTKSCWRPAAPPLVVADAVAVAAVVGDEEVVGDVVADGDADLVLEQAASVSALIKATAIVPR